MEKRHENIKNPNNQHKYIYQRAMKRAARLRLVCYSYSSLFSYVHEFRSNSYTQRPFFPSCLIFKFIRWVFVGVVVFVGAFYLPKTNPEFVYWTNERWFDFLYMENMRSLFFKHSCISCLSLINGRWRYSHAIELRSISSHQLKIYHNMLLIF